MIEYKLTEEVCVQRFIVFLNELGVDIWFVNPTGGPWKTLNIPKVEFGTALGFEKEEARPDIIAFSRDQSICIIIEAKDNISKLSTSSQTKRYVQVFKDIVEKLLNVLVDAKLDYIDYEKLTFVPGYLYPLIGTKTECMEHSEKLAELHHIEALDHNIAVKGHLHYAVISDEKKDLTLEIKYYGENGLTEKLQSAGFL